MAKALHILIGHGNVVGCMLLFTYMRTPLTHYYLKFGKWTTYMETHPESIWPKIPICSNGTRSGNMALHWRVWCINNKSNHNSSISWFFHYSSLCTSVVCHFSCPLWYVRIGAPLLHLRLSLPPWSSSLVLKSQHYFNLIAFRGIHLRIM